MLAAVISGMENQRLFAYSVALSMLLRLPRFFIPLNFQAFKWRLTFISTPSPSSLLQSLIWWLFSTLSAMCRSRSGGFIESDRWAFACVINVLAYVVWYERRAHQALKLKNLISDFIIRRFTFEHRTEAASIRGDCFKSANCINVSVSSHNTIAHLMMISKPTWSTRIWLSQVTTREPEICFISTGDWF